jgi:hypothetical protein
MAINDIYESFANNEYFKVPKTKSNIIRFKITNFERTEVQYEKFTQVNYIINNGMILFTVLLYENKSISIFSPMNLYYLEKYDLVNFAISHNKFELIKELQSYYFDKDLDNLFDDNYEVDDIISIKPSSKVLLNLKR